MKIEKFYLFLLACFVAIGAYSQDGQQKMTGDEKSQQQSDAKVKVTGQVFDESGEGIPGANVTLKSNPTSGTVTDLDGKFILMTSPQKDVLVVSFIGYNTQEFPLKGKTNVTIQLSQNVNELDAVEIVAFGTQKKESVIGTYSPSFLLKLYIIKIFDYGHEKKFAFRGLRVQCGDCFWTKRVPFLG